MNLLRVIIINGLLFDLLLVLLSIARLNLGLLTLNRSLTLYFLRRLGALLFRKWWFLIWFRLILGSFTWLLRLFFWTMWTLILFFANTCFLAFLFLWKLFRTVYLSNFQRILREFIYVSNSYYQMKVVISLWWNTFVQRIKFSIKYLLIKFLYLHLLWIINYLK